MKLLNHPPDPPDPQGSSERKSEMNYYEAQCQPLCKLDESVIGDTAAHDIAALYQGPSGNRSLFGKRVARVIGRDVAYASLTRHTEHYRERVSPFPDQDLDRDLVDEYGFGTADELLADLEAAHLNAPGMGWRPHINRIRRAVKVHGDDFEAILMVHDQGMFDLAVRDRAAADKARSKAA
jgi:hypothetical protein